MPTSDSPAASRYERDPLGEVWDGDGARWRCRIECKCNWRGQSVYRWVLERKFVSWRDFQSGWWTRSEEKAWRRGHVRLASHDADRYEEVGRV